MITNGDMIWILTGNGTGLNAKRRGLSWILVYSWRCGARCSSGRQEQWPLVLLPYGQSSASACPTLDSPTPSAFAIADHVDLLARISRAPTGGSDSGSAVQRPFGAATRDSVLATRVCRLS
jgi:hypothetical protein